MSMFLLFRFVLAYVSTTKITSVHVKLGSILRHFTASGTFDVTGVEYITSFLMAINHLNNKSDGIYDNISKNLTLTYVVEIPLPLYVEAINSAEELVMNRLGGVDSVIGPTFTGTTQASSQIFAQYAISQVGWSSDSTFSFKANYPYYASVTPSDGYQGYMLASLCKNVFGWTKVSLFCLLYTSDAADE